jgi:magnesium-protoporphyrin O-methyltransferase
LEIGGGGGELHVEPLRRGTAHLTNLEPSENDEVEAAQLPEDSGMTAPVTPR